MAEVTLAQLAGAFLRMGAIGYGGPLALVALMEREVCERRKWVSRERFTEAFLYCKLLPGPAAYQMALWIGHELRGRVGGVVTGVCFVLPAFLLMLALSVFYGSFQMNDGVALGLRGLRAGALVLIFQSAWGLLKPFRANARAWAFIVVAAVLMLWVPRWEPLIVISAGLAVVFWERWRPRKLMLFPLFWLHFKAGATVFGTGFAIIPFLEGEVVRRLGWMPANEFLDGIAFGQITPGPITIASAFIGYRVASVAGAVAATVGMYLPGVFFILFVLPWLVRRIRGKAWLTQFQAGALPAVIGCLIGASLVLGKASLDGGKSVAVFAVLAAAAIFSKVPGWLLIPIGGVLSYVAGP